MTLGAIARKLHRIAICGATFVLGIVAGLFCCWLVLGLDIYSNPNATIIQILQSAAYAGVVVWLFGCMFSSALIVIDGRFGHKVGWFLTPAVSAAILLLPFAFLMVGGRSLYFSGDQLVVVVAGILTGTVVRLTRAEPIIPPDLR